MNNSVYDKTIKNKMNAKLVNNANNYKVYKNWLLEKKEPKRFIRGKTTYKTP